MNREREQSWVEKDLRYLWHPFTQMKAYAREDPVVIERGEGVFLVDTDGNRYYDGVSSIWLNVHGHRTEEIDEAVREQLDRIAHSTLLGAANVPAVELAERLVEVTPDPLRRVFYADSGANAVEIGMKMAIQYHANRAGEPTDRQRFLTFEGGYHGDTFGPMSVVPDDTFHWPFEQLLPDPVQVPFPHPYRWSGTGDPERVLTECLTRVEDRLTDHLDELAGVLVEPVQGAGGMIVPPEGFLRGLRDLCDEHGVLLLVDEVATGFGRTGDLFACLGEGISPDIMMLGKGITGGYLPLSAAMATEELYDEFLGEVEEKKALFHGHSYTGNALGCVAGLASLNRLEREVLPSLDEKASLVRDALTPLEEEPVVGEYRQSGLMCAIELVKDPETKTPFPYERRAGDEVRDRARERGMLIRPIGNNVLFLPPLASSLRELGEMTEVLVRSVRRAQDDLIGDG